MALLGSLDHQLFGLINGTLHHPLLDVVMPFITDFGNFKWPLVAAVAVVLALGPPERRWRLLQLVLLVLLADMTGGFIKEWLGVARPSPDQLGEEGVRLVGHRLGKSASFPSNHAVNMFAACGFLWWHLRHHRWAPLLFAPAAMVAWSRVYVGVHWPSDVVGGAVVGLGVLAGFLWLDRERPIMLYENGRRVGFSLTGLAIFFAVFVTMFRLSYVAQEYVDLASEEAQYWSWSRRLDWSYYSKPPLIAYSIRFFCEIFGDTALGVRGGAIVMSAVMMAITWSLVMGLFRDERIAALSILGVNAIPMYAVGAAVMTTDTPLLLFWSATLWALQRAIFEERHAYWRLVAVFLGLGLLSKYAMLYLIPCVALFLVLSPRYRHLLRTPAPYGAVVVGLGFFAPVLVWNARNDWVTFRHVYRLAGGGAPAPPTDLGERLGESATTFFQFFGGQVGFITPLLFGAICWVVMRTFVRRDWRLDDRALFLACGSMPILVFFHIKSLFGNTYANWGAMAYYTAAILVVWWLVTNYDQATDRAGRLFWRRWGIAMFGLAAVFTVGVHFGSDVYRSLNAAWSKATGRTLSPKLDPMYQLIGWRKLASEVTEARSEMLEPDYTFIFAPDYHTASLMAFYVEGQPVTYNPNLGRRMNQFDIWGGLVDQAGNDAIYVTGDDDETTRPHRLVRERFAQWQPPQIVSLGKRGVEYKEFRIFKLHQYDGKVIGKSQAGSY